MWYYNSVKRESDGRLREVLLKEIKVIWKNLLTNLIEYGIIITEREILKEIKSMCRIVVKYRNKRVTSFQCPTEKVNEGLQYLGKRYPQCTFSVLGTNKVK